MATNAAFAHSPYLIPYAKIEGPEQQALTVYGWHGDGIFFTDPVAILVMDENNRIYAQTEVAAGVSVLCFDIKKCWVFLESGVFPFNEVFKLNLPDKIPDNLPQYKKEYPEHSKLEAVNFKAQYFLIPFSFLIYPITNLLWFIPLVLIPVSIYFAGSLLTYTHLPRYLKSIAKFILFLISGLCHLMAFLLCSVGKIGLFPYLIVAWILLYTIANRYLRKRSDRKSKSRS